MVSTGGRETPTWVLHIVLVFLIIYSTGFDCYYDHDCDGHYDHRCDEHFDHHYGEHYDHRCDRHYNAIPVG